jgi:sigma-E factor negative regulatory protein RseA
MKNKISALMDGELALDEHDAGHMEHLFTSIKAGRESAESWATYHLIGDVMRGNPAFSPGFQQRLMQKLEKEATVLAPHSLAPHFSTNETHQDSLLQLQLLRWLS